MESLPRIVSNSEVYGTFKEGHLLEGIPIAGLIGDQQAALVGNKCLKKGDAKQTYGESKIVKTGQFDSRIDSIISVSQVLDVSCCTIRVPISCPRLTVSLPPSDTRWEQTNLFTTLSKDQWPLEVVQYNGTLPFYFITYFRGNFVDQESVQASRQFGLDRQPSRSRRNGRRSPRYWRSLLRYWFRWSLCSLLGYESYVSRLLVLSPRF